MSPNQLLEVLFVASGATTDEEKARIAWRASDFMWRDCLSYGINYCRTFNNLLQGQNWPWVENLWSEEEAKEYHARLMAGK